MIAPVLFAALALAAAQTPPDATGWPQIAQDHEGRYYLDRDSVRRDGPTVRFRAFAQALPGGVQGVHRAVMEIAINCTARTAAFEGGQIYGAGNEVLANRRLEPAEIRYQPIASGSMWAQMAPHVCGGS